MINERISGLKIKYTDVDIFQTVAITLCLKTVVKKSVLCRYMKNWDITAVKADQISPEPVRYLKAHTAPAWIRVTKTVF